MARTRRVLGPLFYSAVSLSAFFLLGLGAWRVWPDLSRTWTLWTLSRQLGDADPMVRSAAADELVRFGSEARPWLTRALKGDNPDARMLACKVLGRIRMSVEVIPDLIATLGDSNARVRLAAAENLRTVWLEAGLSADDQTKLRASEALRRAIEDPSWEVRMQALWTMSDMDPKGDSFATEVERATQDVDYRIRAAAALVFHDDWPESPRAMAALRAMIGDPGQPGDDPAQVFYAKVEAADRLMKSAGEGTVLETLMPLLASPDSRARLCAVRILPSTMTPTGALHAALRRALRDGHSLVRGEAARKLLALPGRKADAEIIAALKAAAEVPVETSYQLSWLYQYISILQELAPGSEVRGVPALIGAIDRVGPADQTDIVDFLGSIGPGAKTAVPRLITLSRSPDARLSAGAALALGKIAPEVTTP